MADEKEMLENFDGEQPDIVEFTDENGNPLRFFHIGTIEYENRFFAFFTAAEEIEGVEEDEVFIYEIAGNPGEEELLPIEDEPLLDAVYEEFCKIMDGECDDDCECCHHHDHCDHE